MYVVVETRVLAGGGGFVPEGADQLGVQPALLDADARERACSSSVSAPGPSPTHRWRPAPGLFRVLERGAAGAGHNPAPARPLTVVDVSGLIAVGEGGTASIVATSASGIVRLDQAPAVGSWLTGYVDASLQ